MNFNKLYNIILQSIINQNKASRKEMLAKLKNHQYIEGFLNEIAKFSNKTADFLAKYFASGELTDVEDPRIDQVVEILKRKTDYNIYRVVTLKDFLKQNETFYKRQQDKKTADEIIDYIDKNVPEFSQKTELKNGVIIYRVQQSQKAQKAVRKVIDLCWGTGANPWCLASRRGGINVNYNNYWNQYNAYPKHIAFQNGKLLAFCANDSQKNVWWNRQDKDTDQLQLLDHSFMNTPKYVWNNEQKLTRFLQRNKDKLVHYAQTDSYECRGDLQIYDKDIIDGHLPVKFTEVMGCFDISHLKRLTTLEGCPKKVTVDFDVSECPNIISLQGAPEYVGGDYDCSSCKKLTSLKGMPKRLYGSTELNNLPGITNLQGAPEIVDGYFYVSSCDNLTSLIGSPKKIKGQFAIDCDRKLKTLQSTTEEVDGDFNINCLDNLISCKGLPKLIKGDLWLHFCDSVKSLDCSETVVKGNFYLRACPKLKSLANGPTRVSKKLVYGWNERLKITEADKQKYKLLEKQGQWQCDE